MAELDAMYVCDKCNKTFAGKLKTTIKQIKQRGIKEGNNSDCIEIHVPSCKYHTDLNEKKFNL